MKWRTTVVLTVAVLATAYALIGVTSWKYSVVGDEWTYLDQGRAVAEHKFLVNPLDRGAGPAGGEHPLLVSFIQALLMCVFGFDMTGLKISSIVLIFPSLILLYRFARVLIGENAALFAVILMAPSKYLVNFFKIGYAHSICFFMFLLCLHLATRLLRKPTKQNAIDLGLALGFAFYIYIGPLFVLFVAPFVVAAMRRNRKNTIRAVAVVGLVFLFVASIGFFSTPPEKWFGGLAKTPLGRGFSSLESELLGIGRYFLLFFTNFDYFYDHFVAGPYLDFVSRWLALIGILISLVKIRGRSGLLLCLWCVVCIVLGATNPYPWTPSTRGIFLVSLGAMFAGIGLEAIRRKLPALASQFAVALALLVAITLNVYEAQIGVWKTTGHSHTALVMRELRRPVKGKNDILIFHSSTFTFRDYHLKRLMSELGMNDSRLVISTDPKEVCLTDRDTVIVFAADKSGTNTLSVTCPDLASRTTVLRLEGRYP